MVVCFATIAGEGSCSSNSRVQVGAILTTVAAATTSVIARSVVGLSETLWMRS